MFLGCLFVAVLLSVLSLILHLENQVQSLFMYDCILLVFVFMSLCMV